MFRDSPSLRPYAAAELSEAYAAGSGGRRGRDRCHRFRADHSRDQQNEAILFVALRRALDVALVLAPLLLSTLMTVIAMVLAAAAAAQLRKYHRVAAAARCRHLFQHLFRNELAGRSAGQSDEIRAELMMLAERFERLAARTERLKVVS